MSRLDWRTSTPTELLDGNVVLTLTEVAYVLGLAVYKGAHKGDPDKRRVLALVDAGLLRPVDPSQVVGRMTISCATVRAYLNPRPTFLFPGLQEAL